MLPKRAYKQKCQLEFSRYFDVNEISFALTKMEI